MTQTHTQKTVAVFFGGPSPEHDVSVITALQVIKALDTRRYTALPVYIAPDGKWYTGDALLDRANYLFDEQARKNLVQVSLDCNRADGTQKAGRLIPLKQKLFGSSVPIEFDVAIPAFHGLYGEDGNFQGLMEFASIPYVGVRTMASTILMDKITTKRIMRDLDIPVLPCAEIKRPHQGTIVPTNDIEAAMKAAKIKFPCILKPTHLGSSIGVAKVTNAEEVSACLPAIFDKDNSAILEPFVENLAEYNVAVARIDNEVRTSAIERPKAADELLDFKQKYKSGGDDKGGTKDPGQASEGMLSLTRELNPDLPKETQDKIKNWVTTLFEVLECGGAPRIDCISNAKTGEIWLNEVNPFPGSLGYFLWEATPKDPLLFSELLDALLDEALAYHKAARLPKDPVPKDAHLLKRVLSE